MIGLAIAFTYFAPGFFFSVFYLGTLIAYFRDDVENTPFWLAYFLVLSDGFFGFFEHTEALIELLPGLPGIEIAQLFALVTILKVWKRKAAYVPFYNFFLHILLVYVIFLLVQGQVLGLSSQLNVQLRMIKWLLPLTLLFTLPKLMDRVEKYLVFFKLIFPVAIFALFAQVFHISTGISPLLFFGLSFEEASVFTVKDGITYRGFYNISILIIAYLGALVCLALKTEKFKSYYLYLIVFAVISAVFLSATRGWVVAFSMNLFFFFLIIGFKLRHIGTAFLVVALLLVGMNFLPIVEKQVQLAMDRLLTLSAITKGDLTADGTLVRVTERGPRVMKQWKESPLTGLGYSNEFIRWQDGHVGNQNILLHSGIAGALLFLSFLLYFHGKLILRSFSLSSDHLYKRALLIFPTFFLGWFFIHSTSGQHFAYYAIDPSLGIIQAVFFGFAGLLYHKSIIESQPDTDPITSEKTPHESFVV